MCCLQDLLRWLADRPNVHSIAPRAQVRPANFMATGICQSATAGGVDPMTSQVLNDADTRPIWAAGLLVLPCPKHAHKCYNMCLLHMPQLKFGVLESGPVHSAITNSSVTPTQAGACSAYIVNARECHDSQSLCGCSYCKGPTDHECARPFSTN